MKTKITTDKIKKKVSVTGKNKPCYKHKYPRKKEGLYVLDPANFDGSVLTFMKDGMHCAWKNRTLKQIRTYEGNPNIIAIPWRELEKYVIQYHKSLCKPFEEISEDDYWEYLGCVPPKRHRRGTFFVGECYSGPIYRFCFELNGKYYSAYRSIKLPDEYLDNEINEFAKALKEK